MSQIRGKNQSNNTGCPNQKIYYSDGIWKHVNQGQMQLKGGGGAIIWKNNACQMSKLLFRYSIKTQKKIIFNLLLL